MSSIDERIVSMQFDNKQFEAGAQTSMSTLDKLKEKLSFTGATEGLSELGKAANKLDFGNITLNIDGLTTKFTAFQSFVHGIFESMGQDVFNFGKRLANSLTLDQIVAGWSKYGEMATSVASIIAATGQSQEEVYSQLDKLNWFSDATSYSLTQMTSAYSKFSAAGIESEESLKAIMGLATAASRAGISASDPRFNSVLYNTSQAMGMGYMGTMDWRSLELANITTVEFKKELMKAGVAMGTLRQEGDKYYTVAKGTEVTAENLRSTLDEKWVTKDTMLAGFGVFGGFVDEVYEYATKNGVTAEQAMKDLAAASEDLGYKAFRSAQETKTWAEAVDATKDAVSTLWMKIYQDIIGNYEEAKEVWGAVSTVLYDIFAAPLEKAEKVIGKWKSLGGRTQLIEGIKNLFEGLSSVVEAVKEGLKDLFPNLDQWKIAGKNLLFLTTRFKNWTETLKPSEETLSKITRVFKGVAAVVEIVKTVVSGAWSVFKDFFSTLTSGHTSVLDIAAAFGDWLVNLAETIKTSETFKRIIEDITNALHPLAEFLSEIINNFVSRFKSEGGGLMGIIQGVFGTLLDFVGLLISGFEKITGWDLSGILGGLVTIVTTLRDKLKDFVGLLTDNKDLSVWETVKLIFSNISETLAPIVSKISSAFDKAAQGAKKFVESINLQKLIDGFNSIWEWIKTTGSKVKEWIKGLANDVKKIDGGALTNIFGQVGAGIGGVTIFAIARKIQDLVTTIKGIAGVGTKFSEFIGGIKTSLIELSNAAKTSYNAKAVESIAASVIMLAIAMKLVSTIPADKVGVAGAAITGALVEVVGAMAIVSKIKASGPMIKMAFAMLILSGAVLTLSSAAKDLASLSWGELLKGLTGVGALLGALIVTTKLIDSKSLLFTGMGLKKVAASIKILSEAALVFAGMTWEELGKAGASIVVLLAALAGFTHIVKPANLKSTGLALIEVAFALKIMASAAQSFGEMEWEDLGKAGASIVVLLAALAGFSQITKGGTLIAAGLGLIEIGLSLKIFASAAKEFAVLDWEQLGKAGAAIGGILLAVGLFSAAIATFAGGGLNLIAMGAGLILVAAGLKTVASVVTTFADLSWEEIIKGLVGLGGVLLELGLALTLMQSSLGGAASLLIAAVALNALVPVISLFSSMSWDQLIISLVGFAGALGILIAAGALAVVVAPGLLLLSAAMIGVGAGFMAIGVGVAALSTGVAVLAAMGLGSIEVFLLGLQMIVTTILTMLPDIATAFANSLIVFVVAIGEGAADILDAVVKLGSAILSALTTLIPQLIELITQVLLAILEAIIQLTPKIVEAGITVVTALLQGLATLIPQVVGLFMDLITNLLETIAEKLPDYIQAGVDLIVAFMEGIASAVPQLIDAGYQMMIDFINGTADAIEKNTEPLLDAIDHLIKAVLEAGIAVLTHGIENFKECGQLIMESGLIQGLKDKVESLISTVKEFAASALQKVTNTLSSWWQAGKDLIEKLLSGIGVNVEAVKTKVSTMMSEAKEKITGKFTEWWQAGKDLIQKIIDGIGNMLSNIKEAVSNLISNAIGSISDSEWYTSGQNMIMGFINGVKDKAESLAQSAKQVVQGAVTSVKRFLRIESPSKLMRELGVYTDEGFIIGIEKEAGAVSSSMEGMVTNGVKAMNEAVDDGFIFGEWEADPVVRPVMDLTEIQNGMNYIDSMTGDYAMPVRVSGLADISNNVDSMQQESPAMEAIRDLKNQFARLVNTPSQTFNNTFNINGDNAEELANQLSSILQQQLERNGAVWA